MVGQSNAPRLNGEDEGRILNCEANLRTPYTHIDQNVNMRSHLEEIVSYLGGYFQDESSAWINCPLHLDSGNSAKITADGNDLHVYCTAGCKREDIKNALLENGLWPNNGIEDESQTDTNCAEPENKYYIVVPDPNEGSDEQNYDQECNKLVRTTTFPFVHVENLQCKEPRWVLYNYLQENSLNLIFGDPKCGKSFLALDLACCVATGKDFHGLPVDYGSVAYIAGEGLNGLIRRKKAWSLANDVQVVDYLYLSERSASLTDSDSVSKIVSSLDELHNYKPLKLVVIDTLARNFGDGDENSTKDMNRFIQSVDYIRERYGCAMLIVHHTGTANKERERGAFALRGAIDTGYKIEKDSNFNQIKVKPVITRDTEPPESKVYKLLKTDLNFLDSQGQQVTSAVLCLTNNVFNPQATKNKDSWLDLAWKELIELLGDSPDQGVSEQTWKNACFEKNMTRQNFCNIKKKLLESNIVIKDGTVYLAKSSE